MNWHQYSQENAYVAVHNLLERHITSFSTHTLKRLNNLNLYTNLFTPSYFIDKLLCIIWQGCGYIYIYIIYILL